MPRIFDNIDQSLLPALRETLGLSDRADFCVGYFNLRGWRQIDEEVDRWAGGPGKCCRLLVGMQKLPADELHAALGTQTDDDIDNQRANRLKKKLAEEFRNQLTFGLPSDADEAGLRRLAAQIRSKKVVVKLFLRHPLHAKLYLLFRPDPISPKIGYLGSSNLTFAGLARQGELNIDVLDHDACQKLAAWFEARWDDRWCVDISDELAGIIESSWARERPLSPYHVYIKMAWHLSREARAGLNEFRVPRDFDGLLFEFQQKAVQIAAQHLNKRGGVLIGDVVGLGKTLIATALARTFEDVHDLETLILCPKNLVEMWEDHRETYRLRGKVLPISRAVAVLPSLRRYRIVLIDESHNLRNREGRRYRVIRDYIQANDSKVILLSATPYNKSYLDLGNQLRLFLEPDANLGVRPEHLIRELGDIGFRRLQVAPHTLAAFEKSHHADDWRELMKFYLVRRTRTFIQDNYAETDLSNGRKYLTFPNNGKRSYFPERVPKTLTFAIDDRNPADQYGQLYSDDVVIAVNHLNLPRYGLGNYVDVRPHDPPTTADARVIADLSRAGRRLMGFCRTNLFKRLESSGYAFLQSVERHILRNFVYLHALENGLSVPVGTQDAAALDPSFEDRDDELFADEDDDRPAQSHGGPHREWRDRAAEVYREYAGTLRRRFKWLPADRFIPMLASDLLADAEALIAILNRSGPWDPARDSKLDALTQLVMGERANQKVLIFTQFADTVAYLVEQLRARGVNRVAGVTGDAANPTHLAWRFSPVSNQKRAHVVEPDELRVLVATDVLSEGQNLQDAAIVVNFDLPWAIIRLIQRAGRVDRIGQQSDRILCYTFLPADGVERIIRLRARVRQRLQENAEVVGTDESFFEDERNEQVVRDLFTEKSGVLDDEADDQVDLTSTAWQIWKNATDRDPSLLELIPDLPNVVYSTKSHPPSPGKPAGVLAFVRTAQGTDALAWLDRDGNSVTESQFAILRAAECQPEEPPMPRHANHHALVAKAVELLATEEKTVGGNLGKPSGARFRCYDRLKRFADEVKGTLYDTTELRGAVEDIHNYTLRPLAVDLLNRQLRSGIADADLASCVVELRREGRLSVIHEDEDRPEPQIICSLGLSGLN